jgi:hypothetical protein
MKCQLSTTDFQLKQLRYNWPKLLAHFAAMAVAKTQSGSDKYDDNHWEKEKKWKASKTDCK